jgi:hypothetical protein
MRKAPANPLEYSESIAPLELIFAHHNIEGVLGNRLVQILFAGDLMQHGSWKSLPQVVCKAPQVIRIIIDD